MGRTLVIAEAGVNHNGSLEMAKKLVDVAHECGADVVKFQTAKLDSLVSKTACMADYQKHNIGVEESQKDMLQKLLLDFQDFIELNEYCKKVGIMFLSTPFDIESIHFLNDMQDIWKIPSGEITNYPYLVQIGETKKPVIMSTGMSNLEEIEHALEILRENGSGEISLLHCNTQYPTPFEDANLKAILTLKEKFGVKVGFSDHTLGIEASIAAVAIGAEIVEKHFTLDGNMKGPDHKASLEPKELATMISSIRHTEVAMGSGEKVVTESERNNMVIARKSIVAKTDIKKGEILTVENITTKRPGSGISPMKWNSVLGTAAIRDFLEDELIKIDN